ncbi:MAG TPA: tRNA dihydrouridine synthase DusB [Candidatus Binatia bacterium]|jgi:tRNA-dihydrouridine synthase B|nr:tRNA dihydrouridine synthase DusB [Candidatus Binatia bacterium]
MFDWSSQKKPIIALSPMADMTDSAFCRIAKRFAAPVVFREMISAEGLVHGSEKSFAMGRFVPEERPIVQQLFGADPKSMGDAVRMIDEAYSPDGFDVNMGCPVYKIVSNFNGAALMKDAKLATSIIESMRAATTKPVSVKLRLGWQDPTEVLEFIKVVEAAGAALVTVHGRTKAQGYSGVADWEMVGRAARNVSIPVLCNGDVHAPETAAKALEVSGCDGLLIARGALGNPWIFSQIEDVLAGRPHRVPTQAERCAVVREHAALHAELYGGDLVSFRKHLTWYFKGIPGAKAYRDALMRVSTLADLDDALSRYLAEYGDRSAAPVAAAALA